MTPISDDVNDLKGLTPSHFIIGSYENTVPGVFHKQEIDYRQKSSHCRRLLVQMKERIFTIFKPLQNTDAKNHVGDLVIISSHDVPRSYWPMGRIIEVYAGRDGFVRSVKLKTSNGELSRPSALLCFLEPAD